MRTLRTMRITHELKTWPEFFRATLDGTKKFELRRNDRDYRVGDQLLLKEWNPQAGVCLDIARPEEHGSALGPPTGGYTGREVLVRVDYIMDSQQVDEIMLKIGDTRSPGYVIMSISLVS